MEKYKPQAVTPTDQIADDFVRKAATHLSNGTIPPIHKLVELKNEITDSLDQYLQDTNTITVSERWAK